MKSLLLVAALGVGTLLASGPAHAGNGPDRCAYGYANARGCIAPATVGAYRIGLPLSRDYGLINDHRRFGLAGPPRGYRYAQAGGDILLVLGSTREVISVVSVGAPRQAQFPNRRAVQRRAVNRRVSRTRGSRYSRRSSAASRCGGGSSRGGRYP